MIIKWPFHFYLLLTLMLNACVHSRELVSFPADKTTFTSPEQLKNAVELQAQPDDLLRITVNSFNMEAAAPFNVEAPLQQNMQQLQQTAAAQGNYTLELFNGYFVDREGYINFPVLGRLKVGGLTLPQIEKMISDGTQVYLKDAVVNARFLNFKVTVLGEVNRPGTVRISNQRINLLEILGNAGDFTPYANRTNVLLIREENGQRTYQRLNFQSEALFHSPYFYLKQNDVLYVEPIRAKVATVQDPFARGVTYGTAFISVITLAFAIFR